MVIFMGYDGKIALLDVENIMSLVFVDVEDIFRHQISLGPRRF